MPFRIVVSAIVLCALFALPFIRSGATGATVDATVTPKPLTCSLSGPCAETNNSSSGSGYEGISTSGAGVKAVSTKGQGLYATSASGSFMHPGVEGESLNEGGNDAGALFGGKALTDNKGPGTGVIAYGQYDGVLGRTTRSGASGETGYGVEGDDPVYPAPSAKDYNAGVFGRTTAGSGVLAEANSSPQSGLFGGEPVGLYATAATYSGTSRDDATAIVAESNSTGIDVYNPSNGSAVYTIAPGYLMEGFGPDLYGFTFDNSGNETLNGMLTTSKGVSVRSATRSGTAMMEYSDRTTVPQIEDVGEAQLEGGRGYVAIDARLADTIDRRIAYHVFVTPEGDC
ncbi:MAG: hypothetical protein IAI50_15200, partial [Candidatus Eremiobacteraeota bacterium]|nr:hypothetical protein [Candidatus Eremiobacteraeota bacterium]